MFQSNTQPWIITLSIHVYRWIIRLGPKEFRHEYGEVTLQDFHHCCRRAYKQGGIWSVLQLWPLMFTGAVIDMGAEHVSEAARSKKSAHADNLQIDMVDLVMKHTEISLKKLFTLAREPRKKM